MVPSGRHTAPAEQDLAARLISVLHAGDGGMPLAFASMVPPWRSYAPFAGDGSTPTTALFACILAVNIFAYVRGDEASRRIASWALVGFGVTLATALFVRVRPPATAFWGIGGLTTAAMVAGASANRPRAWVLSVPLLLWFTRTHGDYAGTDGQYAVLSITPESLARLHDTVSQPDSPKVVLMKRWHTMNVLYTWLQEDDTPSLRAAGCPAGPDHTCFTTGPSFTWDKPFADGPVWWIGRGNAEVAPRSDCVPEAKDAAWTAFRCPDPR